MSVNRYDSDLKICFATSECVPFVKTGGLADVSGALPKALESLGCDVKVFLPLYHSIRVLDYDFELLHDMRDITVQIGSRHVQFSVWEGFLPDSDVSMYFIDCPTYYHRKHVYTNDPDEDERFILFQHAVLLTLQRLKWAPHIMHCNDWQTSLLPALLKTTYAWDQLFTDTKSLLTIHNVGYQGRFSKDAVVKAGLPIADVAPGGPFELDGASCFLKAGILFSEIINAVSPNYAREIQTKEFGAGLEGVLATRHSDVHGVLNGIDTTIWSPSTDTLIPHTYSVEDLSGKRRDKIALLQDVELPYAENIPLIGIISRFTGQKGFDLLIPVMDALLHQPLQFAVLGSGEHETEQFFRRAAERYPEKVFTYIGFHNTLAHHITAASDMFLMPSLYEPCGLNQMYSLVYGTIPIVRKTGGLADTVLDYHEHNSEGNGFSFQDRTPSALYETVLRAISLFHEKHIWDTLISRGMTTDFSWRHSAREYIALYLRALRR